PPPQAAFWALDSPGTDLSCGGGATIHHHHEWIIFPAISMSGAIDLFGGIASVMRNDDGALVQELVGNAHALAQQPTWVLAKIEYEAIEIAIGEAVERLLHFVLGSFLESVYVNVTDSLADLEGNVHAVARY